MLFFSFLGEVLNGALFHSVKVQEIRAASGDLTRLLAEKDALESVALQLAQERDSAMAEVSHSPFFSTFLHRP